MALNCIFMFILFALFAAVLAVDEDDLCYAGETNCLKCVDFAVKEGKKDENEGKTIEPCGFCFSDKRCYKKSSLAKNCTSGDVSTTRDKKCVAELGGDANPKVRYIVGTIFIVVAILVDLSCRFLYKKPKAQAFLKQIVTIE